MFYIDENDVFFGRVREDGDVKVIDVFHESGEMATELPCSNIYPIGSDIGACYTHQDGITISFDDAISIGLEVEDAFGDLIPVSDENLTKLQNRLRKTRG